MNHYLNQFSLASVARSHQTSYLHASETLCWLLRAHGERGGCVRLSDCPKRQNVGGAHREDMTVRNLQAGSRKLVVPRPFPCPWTVCSAHFSQWELFSRIQPWEGKVLLCWEDCVCDHRSEGLSINFKILVGDCREILILQPPKTSLVCNFPCL